jgi:hypothetical protein
MDAFLGSPPAGLLRRFLTALPTQVRDKVRSKSDRLLADLLLNPNSVGSAELARIMSQSELSSAPPSVLRGAIPANAVNSVVEQ